MNKLSPWLRLIWASITHPFTIQKRIRQWYWDSYSRGYSLSGDEDKCVIDSRECNEFIHPVIEPIITGYGLRYLCQILYCIKDKESGEFSENYIYSLEFTLLGAIKKVEDFMRSKNNGEWHFAKLIGTDYFVEFDPIEYCYNYDKTKPSTGSLYQYITKSEDK